jgi:hypothetical protein
MSTYDLYQFASDQDLILGWHKFDAEDDEAALAIGEGLAQQAPLELWQDNRLVKRWESPAGPSPRGA